MIRSDFNRGWAEYPQGHIEQKKAVTLPHDAMLEEQRIPKLVEGAATGYFPGGKYVYEKDFSFDRAWQDKRVFLEFEGIYQKSSVYLNDQYIGGHQYGYTGFCVELTDALCHGENHLAVIADNSQTPNSRWYTGSGIYRPVHLLVGGKSCIAYDGIRVAVKSITVTEKKHILGEDVPIKGDALIEVETMLSEGSDLGEFTESAIIEVLDSEGLVIAKAHGVKGEINLTDVLLWSELSPSLYCARVTLPGADEGSASFGVRKLDWHAKQGLTVNGRPVKLRGACIHHDNGILGAKEYREAAYRRIRKLKACGYNAIRSAHNPISRSLLSACDELGMFIMDETFDVWLTSKNSYDYSLWFEKEWRSDTIAMVRKDFNHPSVILYSIGNEITDVGTVYGVELQKQMVSLIHDEDPSRPVTNAVNIMAAMGKLKDKKKPNHKKTTEDQVDPKRSGTFGSMVGSKLINNIVTLFPKLIASVKAEQATKNLKPYLETVDIVGFNYGHLIMKDLAKHNPDKVVLNTETFPKSIGQSWPVIEHHPQLIGDFMWTGWDYLGEAGIGVCTYGKAKKQFNKPYPCVGAGMGSVNLIGEQEAQGYYSQAAFHCLEAPYIGVRPLNHQGENVEMGQWRGTDCVDSWTWKGYEGKTATVHVFSDDGFVELILNGESLGKKPVTENLAAFEVTYTPGELTAVHYDTEGKESTVSVLKTAEGVSTIQISAEKHEPEDEIIFVNISLVDRRGVLNRYEDRRLSVKIEGAELLGLGSGNPITAESYLADSFTTWNGRLLAAVRKQRAEDFFVLYASDRSLNVEASLF